MGYIQVYPLKGVLHDNHKQSMTTEYNPLWDD